MKKKNAFFLSLVAWLFMALATCPFCFDPYLHPLHSAISLFLNLFSSLLFSTFLFFLLTKNLGKKKLLFLFLTLFQGIGHGIFLVMNWGSFLFLPLSFFLFLGLILDRK